MTKNPVENAKTAVRALLEKALAAAVAAGALPPAPLPAYVVEIPGDTTHGDFAANIAMVGARAFGKAPRVIAQALLDHLDLAGSVFTNAEVAGPGFLNFFVGHAYFEAIVADVLAAGADWGRTNWGAGRKAMVEFVSANPTGPMHLGNARGGAMGDTLAAVLDWSGWNVTREFYINDAGNQIRKFGASIGARYMQHYLGEEAVPFPEDGYHGADITALALRYIDQYGDDLLEKTEDERAQTLAAYGLPLNVDAMKQALRRYNIEYDVWFSEQSLHEAGAVRAAVEKLGEKGATYEKDGAVWYRSAQYSEKYGANKKPKKRDGTQGETEDGPKDEVLVRQNGIPTYFTADIAYHYNKFAIRGFDLVIDVWGADHAGHVARMKGSMDAIGLDGTKLDIVLMQMVRLMKDGAPVRMSKRTGNAITLETLLDEVPVDSARFFFNLREPGSQIDFDMDLAVAQNSDNPVYYVQYAHARICSLLRALETDGVAFAGAGKADFSLLTDPTELALCRRLAALPVEIESAARTYDPARITRYVSDLAAEYHRFYTACRVRGEEPALLQARLGLSLAVKQALANGLSILKVSCPEQM